MNKPTLEQVEALVKERYQYADSIRKTHIATVAYAVLDLIDELNGLKPVDLNSVIRSGKELFEQPSISGNSGMSYTESCVVDKIDSYFPQCGHDIDYAGLPGVTYCTLKKVKVNPDDCKSCSHFKKNKEKEGEHV